MSSSVIQSLKQQVYDFRPELKDWKILLGGVIVVALFGKLFYGNLYYSIFLSPMIIPWYWHQKKKQKKRDGREIGIQFRDAMMAVSTSQKAGYSIENSFVMAMHDMKLLYGKNSLIYKELNIIARGLKNNVTLEKLLEELGERSGNKDIKEFATVFNVAKRNGGNLTKIIGRTVDVIGSRMSVEKEIDVIISAKRMEAEIMDIVPFAIIMYVGSTSPGFFDPLYNSIYGFIVMTACMAVYIASFLLSEKIVDIDI